MNRQIKTIFKQLFKIFLKASKDALTITHGNNQKKKGTSTVYVGNINFQLM